MLFYIHPGEPMGAPVTVRPVETSRDMRAYLALPYKLHDAHELWVPPLRLFEKNFLNPKNNRHFAYSATACFLARRRGEPAGRIMGIINRKLNETWGTLEARFCNFESVDDEETAGALLGAVELWARENGMRRVVGPLGFSNQDPQGFLVEGFGERPSIGTLYNFDYIPRLLENAGYRKEVDYVTYGIPIFEKIPRDLEKISGWVEKRLKVRLIEPAGRGEAKRWLPRALRFMNETYTDIYGFIPLDEDVIRKISRTYAEIMDPAFLKIVVNERGETVGFMFGIRDVTEGFRRARGRLLPFGYFAIKLLQKRARRLDLLLGAIKAEYRGRGIDTLLGIAMVESARARGMEYADSHHELESNRLMRAEMEKVGGSVYKRHRVYRKELV
jgi:hypothetical protein